MRAVIGLLAAAFLAAGFVRAADPLEEPRYKKKTATEWAAELRDPDAGARVDALNALTALTAVFPPPYHLPPDVQRAAAEMLRADPDDDVRSTAAGLFGDCRRPDWEPEVRDAVVAAAADRSRGVRLSAVNSLGHVRPTPTTLAALSKALADPDEDVRSNAAVAVKNLGPAARPAMPGVRRAIRDDPSEHVRFSAAWAAWAVDRDATDAVTVVIDHMLNGTDETVRALVPTLLREMGPAARPVTPHLVWLIKFLDQNPGETAPDRADRKKRRAEWLEVLHVVDPPTGRNHLPDAPAKAGFPKFKVQEIATDLKIGYAVITADLNDDGKPDIVVVDQHRVVWYENPTWKVRTILQGKTKPDNVCIAAVDIDGDGKLDLVLGAGWKPFDTAAPGTLQWLSRGKSPDDEWTMHPIPCDEPTVHRVAVADLNGDGKPEIVLAPLMGRGATAKGNWLDGRPVRIMAYPIPTEPTKPEAWKPVVISEDLHVVHNLSAPATPRSYKTGDVIEYQLFTASYEGVTEFKPFRTPDRPWRWIPELKRSRGGNQANPAGNRGSSEVAALRGREWPRYNWVAAVEPWHGNQVVFYHTESGAIDAANPSGVTRTVLDNHLRWGHAVKLADLDGDGVPEVIAGVRDDPNPKAGDTFADRRGVRIYRTTLEPDPGPNGPPASSRPGRWDRYVLEDGGVAVEDLTVADLNGDGKPDVIAVGRATGNCRIYWNQGP